VEEALSAASNKRMLAALAVLTVIAVIAIVLYNNREKTDA